ncbi:MAG: hypothetical protein ACJ8DQ_06955, partial [Xanthobacteraceae bacterium]
EIAIVESELINVPFGDFRTQVRHHPEIPRSADCVAKRFCASECARSIQDRAPMRNVDSKIHPGRFDRFKFLFHSFAAATFATLSAKCRKAFCV